MDITLQPGKLQGTIAAIPSKSVAHRMLICAAFAKTPTELICEEINEDISATARCLEALGARVARTEKSFTVTVPKGDILYFYWADAEEYPNAFSDRACTKPFAYTAVANEDIEIYVTK